ncbi:hypothetical protein [Dactylosporangium sp. NPDC049140]|uniref:hypothetical protein n=1 Tax=Dactylosporangium sp. NPDC049140 TaxID=3155647 RepID=UPI003408D75D
MTDLELAAATLTASVASTNGEVGHVARSAELRALSIPTLAADNDGTYCAACDAVIDQLRHQPPAVGTGFWTHPTIQDAARRRHMGHLIAAYRRPPQHRTPISQEIVGGWYGVSQGQVNRIETGQSEHNRLIYWAAS